MPDILEKLYLPADCRRILCAVSGGADSVCLLHLLHENSAALGIELCAAHFEHGIRGEESLADAAFVARLCADIGVELITESGDTPGYAEKEGLGLEEAARSLRYAFLERARLQSGCDCIATAHNADDNVETVLFNLSRGSGSKGLCGIPPRRGSIIRPLLMTGREEIEAYLTEKGLRWVTDSTNLSDDYSRNLIRHRVTPVLRSINPEIAGAIGRTTRLLRRDEEFLEALAQDFIREHFSDGSLPARELLALHEAVSSRVLRALCPQILGEKHVRSLLGLAAGEGLGRAEVPGLCVRREQGRLFFTQELYEAIAPVELVVGQSVHIPHAKLSIRVSEEIFDGEIHGLFKTYLIKYESICGKLICSSRMPGDRISPQGRNCTKSLKAIFTEKKMTQRQRDLCPVIRDDRGVLVLVGLPADVRCAPAVGDRVIKLELEYTE